MMGHCAITIGINQYTQMTSLLYAQQDAAKVYDYLVDDANFDPVYYFSDTSIDTVLDAGVTVPTQPTLEHLRRFLQVRFAAPFLKSEDMLWFFFRGHGLHYGNRDYLLPCDANPDDPESTAIALDELVTCLKRSGTNNIFLILDACHTEEQKFGQGFGTDPEGVVTLFATDFDQTSQDIPGLNQGAFTRVFLEGLRLLGQFKNATAEHLYLYLRERMPKCNQQYQLSVQLPRLSVSAAATQESIAIPVVAAAPKGWLRTLASQRQVSATMPTAVPLAPYSNSSSTWNVAAGLGFLTVCLALLGYTLSQDSSWNDILGKSQTASATMQQANAGSQPQTNQSAKTGSSARNNASTTSANSATANPGVPDLDALKRMPQPGKYHSADPRFSTSNREIGRNNDRLCIKIVNGNTTANPNQRSQVIVSSLSARKDGYYIDSTNEKIRLTNTYSEFVDSKSLWQRLETDVESTGPMADCLAANVRYSLRLNRDS